MPNLEEFIGMIQIKKWFDRVTAWQIVSSALGGTFEFVSGFFDKD